MIHFHGPFWQGKMTQSHGFILWVKASTELHLINSPKSDFHRIKKIELEREIWIRYIFLPLHTMSRGCTFKTAFEKAHSRSDSVPQILVLERCRRVEVSDAFRQHAFHLEPTEAWNIRKVKTILVKSKMIQATLSLNLIFIWVCHSQLYLPTLIHFVGNWYWY